MDKFTAVWVSHSSISDFLKCPRAYFLKNVYKNPQTGRKMTLMSPPLALGQAVHEVVESLSVLPTEDRFKDSLASKFEIAWKKVSGKLGGFRESTQEQTYKDRGLAMLKRVSDNPGPLKNLAVKIKQDLPYYWLSEQDNIILNGKIDWLEYFPHTESVHIIDFKTGNKEEDAQSLQLPIYYLLATNCQKRPVTKVSYWYIERADSPQEMDLPEVETSKDRVLKIAKQIKLARQLKRFICPHDGCFACKPFESVLAGVAEHVGTDSMRRDIYIAPEITETPSEDSIII